MAKLTLTDGTIFEGTTEELIALTEQFSGKVADPIAEAITHNGVEYTLVNRKAQAGDVVILRDTGGDLFKVGKVYEVLEDVLIADSDGDLFDLYRSELRRTIETVSVYEPKAETLKVGDYVVILSSDTFHTSDYEEGDVAMVTRFRYDGYVFVKSDARNEDHMHPSTLRKATDAEVAEAKESAERNAVFTQAGRKPNEYRKGDIVRISDKYRGYSVNKAGDIGVISRVHYFDSFQVVVGGREGAGNYHGPTNVEIVTFVEERLN